MAFHGSSFFRIPLTAQSYVENNPPQTPKLPPRTGALAFIAVIAPILLSPYGLRYVSSSIQVQGWRMVYVPVSEAFDT
jgi:hypothetical protein